MKRALASLPKSTVVFPTSREGDVTTLQRTVKGRGADGKGLSSCTLLVRLVGPKTRRVQVSCRDEHMSAGSPDESLFTAF